MRINREIYLMSADGSNQARLTNTLPNDHSPAWSSDGMRIVFRSDRERDFCDPTAQLWIMNAKATINSIFQTMDLTITARVGRANARRRLSQRWDTARCPGIRLLAESSRALPT
jgi:dipeptidyl aminopeptidase/acylaminoacyl peptidase